MRKRQLGTTDLMLSPLGLGTVKFGRCEKVKYPKPFKLPSNQTIQDLLALAFDLGINVLDTAPAYGTSETRLGELLSNRQDWILISKTGEAFHDNQSTFNFTPEYTIRSIQNSLKKLKTDYLDLILVHSDGSDLNILDQTGIFEVLADLKKQGWIRAFGMSSKTLAGGLEALRRSDLGMVTYHPNQIEMQPILELAQTLNKGILIKKGFASGHLEKLGSAGSDPIETTLKFIFQQPAVTSLIMGTMNPSHLRENVLTFQRLFCGSNASNVNS